MVASKVLTSKLYVVLKIYNVLAATFKATLETNWKKGFLRQYLTKSINNFIQTLQLLK